MGLFSTHTHSHSSHTETKLVPYEKTVHEHKAPTDQSVKLLNEFQEKAKDNLIRTIHIEENHLKAVVMFFVDEVLTDRIHICFKFILNGKEYLIKEFIDKYEWIDELRNGDYHSRDNRIIKFIFTKFSEAIAIELIKANGETIKKFIH